MRRLKWWKSLLVLLGVLFSLEAVLFAGVILGAARADRPQPSDVIIVLGAGINRYGYPSSTLIYRLERTLELYQQGYAPRIIVTGGQGDDEPMPEAEVMREYLMERGVPARAIYCETTSTNTHENLENARELMQISAMRTALIVTSDYHVLRALALAQDLGIEASGAGAKNASHPYYALRNCFRETLSWIKYAVTR